MEDTRFEEILREDNRRWRRSVRDASILLTIVLLAAWTTGLMDLNRLREGVPDFWNLLREMIPPDFTRAREWVMPLLSTLGMSIAGTALGIAISAPMGLLAAKLTTPNVAVYQLARSVLNLLRAIPELIMGILFVAAVGFGALPGVLAVGLHSVGMMGKFFAEAVDGVDVAPVEAIRSTGAGPLQVIFHGVLPQAWPQWRDLMIYRWEYNFRASTVLGAVGAGGIGTELISSLRILQYRQVLAIILVILAMVSVVDGIGRLLQKRYE